MRSWLQDLGPLLLIWWCAQILLGAVLGSSCRWERRLGRAVLRLGRRVWRGPEADVVTLRRPIEQVGADVRRLREAFGREGMRFAKYEGTRQAYDGALAEAADTLEIAHALAVLPPGLDRDLERLRVEALLEDVGLLPPLRAA